MKRTNERYNHWTILYVDEHYNSKHKKYCVCRCDCGRLYKREYFKLKYGIVAQCRECYLQTRHHLNNTKLHRCWSAMKQRCYNKKEKAYKDYGARGIKVCEQWKNDFLSFYNWATTHGYSDNLSIDRINVDGDYCPKNCRWTDQHTQSANTRKPKTNTTGRRGVSFHKCTGKYRAYICIHRKIHNLGEFDTIEQAANARKDFIKNNNLKEYNE